MNVREKKLTLEDLLIQKQELKKQIAAKACRILLFIDRAVFF